MPSTERKGDYCSRGGGSHSRSHSHSQSRHHDSSRSRTHSTTQPGSYMDMGVRGDSVTHGDRSRHWGGHHDRAGSHAPPAPSRRDRSRSTTTTGTSRNRDSQGHGTIPRGWDAGSGPSPHSRRWDEHMRAHRNGSSASARPPVSCMSSSSVAKNNDGHGYGSSGRGSVTNDPALASLSTLARADHHKYHVLRLSDIPNLKIKHDTKKECTYIYIPGCCYDILPRGGRVEALLDNYYWVNYY